MANKNSKKKTENAHFKLNFVISPWDYPCLHLELSQEDIILVNDFTSQHYDLGPPKAGLMLIYDPV